MNRLFVMFCVVLSVVLVSVVRLVFFLMSMG